MSNLKQCVNPIYAKLDFGIYLRTTRSRFGQLTGKTYLIRIAIYDYSNLCGFMDI